MLKVEYGSIYLKDSPVFIDNMCIIVDKDTGSIMKYGDAESSDIKQYYETMCKKYRDAGFSDIADALILIEFDRYNGILSIEEICTIVNYGMNCHSERCLELFDLEADELHKRIAELQGFGY